MSEQQTTPDNGVPLLLNEAISMCRREGVAGQHIGAMCDARDEIARLTAALAAANASHERYEREWYLRGDELERLQAALLEIEAMQTAAGHNLAHATSRARLALDGQ